MKVNAAAQGSRVFGCSNYGANVSLLNPHAKFKSTYVYHILKQQYYLRVGYIPVVDKSVSDKLAPP